MDIKKTSRLAMLLALSVVFSIIESFIPAFTNILPGLKLGLANAVIIFAIYMYGFKDALYISILRILLVGLLTTGLFNMHFYFSLGGALLSILAMTFLKKTTKLSVVGISIVGAISHNIGQVIVALFLLSNAFLWYLPWLLLFSIPMGLIVGVASKEVLKYYNLK